MQNSCNSKCNLRMRAGVSGKSQASSREMSDKALVEEERGTPLSWAVTLNITEQSEKHWAISAAEQDPILLGRLFFTPVSDQQKSLEQAMGNLDFRTWDSHQKHTFINWLRDNANLLKQMRNRTLNWQMFPPPHLKRFYKVLVLYLSNLKEDNPHAPVLGTKLRAEPMLGKHSISSAPG